MVLLNELIGDGTRRLELFAEDILVVTNSPRDRGTNIRTIDDREFIVAETMGEIFALLGESLEE